MSEGKIQTKTPQLMDVYPDGCYFDHERKAVCDNPSVAQQIPKIGKLQLGGEFN